MDELDEVVTEHVLGSDPQRPLRDALCRSLEEGDMLVVADLVQLARNVCDLAGVVTNVTGSGARIEVLSEQIVLSGDVGQSTDSIRLIEVLARWDRGLWRERHAEGVVRAKSRGVYARSRTRKLDNRQVAEIRAMIDRGESKSEIASRFGISRQSLYKYLRKT